MKRIKRLVSLMLAICILTSMAPAAFAAGGKHHLAHVSVQGETASVRLLAERDCSLFVAQYAEDGRLLETGMANVTKGGDYRTLTVSLQETEEDYDLKVFLLDSVTSKPLCDHYVLKHAGTASERYSIIGLDAEEEGFVATVATDEACTLEVQVWDQDEREILFTTTASAEAGLDLEYVTAEYEELPDYFILQAVLRDEDGNAVSNPFVNRRNTKAFREFANKTEADYRNRTDVTFLEVGEADDGNFMVLNENVTYLTTSASTNTFVGEEDGVLTFQNANSTLTGLKEGDLFAFMNESGEYETVKVKEITVNNGVVSITRDDEVYLADFYDVIKLNADLTYEGDGDPAEAVLLADARAAESETQLLKVKFGPGVKTNLNLGIGSVDGTLWAGGKMSMNLLGEDYMDITVIAGFKGEVDVTLGVAKGWKDTLPLCSIPLAGMKEVLGASLDAELVCQVDSDFGYNFTLEAETCYGFTYSTDTGGQVLKQKHFTQKDADSGSKLAGHAEIEIGIRGGLNLSLLNRLVNVSAGAEGGLVLSGDLEILSGTLPVNAHSYHACDLCINGDCSSYFELDTTVDYKINKWLTGTIVDLDLFRIEATLGSFYLSLLSETDGVHEGKVAFDWAEACPNKKYRVEIHTYDTVSNSEVVGCTVAVINENHNLTSPCKLYLYPGTYTAKATIGPNQAEKTFTVQDAAMTLQLNGQNKMLSGVVSDKYAGRTVEGATVQVYQGNTLLFTTTTNVIGEYAIELPDGDYRVVFTAEDYETRVYQLTLTADKALDVAMESEPYTISFDANGGTGFMDDMEFHRSQTITLPACTFIPPEGKVFGGWLIGNEVICDAGTDYDPPDENQTLTATWKDKAYTVTVTVLNADGTAASGLSIAGTGLATAPVTGTDGTVTFELDRGSYKLSATDANNNYDSEELELSQDTAVTLTLKEPTIEWSLDETTGVLTITGNGGPMPNYASLGDSAAPWSSHRLVGIKSVVMSDITAIGQYAFYGCDNLKSVTIPEGVTSIGNSAFYDCRYLKNLTIPDSVTSIGNYAFHGCSSAANITIPDGITTINDGTFFDCASLTSITIPDSVTSIGRYAFSSCNSLSSVVIPDTITFINDYAFSSCYSLDSIVIPDSVTSIGRNAFSGCTKLTSITIPDSVTSIGDSAFNNCAMTGIAIPDSVTSIGKNAFSGCTKLTSISIPKSVTTISEGMFSVCSALTSITIPDSVTSIGKNAFSGCTKLTSITIPDSVTSIGDYAFNGCTSLSSITLPDRVTHIGVYAFQNCDSLTSVTIPDSVTRINNYAFRYCDNLENVTISGNGATIGKEAFVGCNKLSSVTILDGVATIGEYAFKNCDGLTSVTIAGSTTRIEHRAFQDCDNLTNVTIPDGVTYMGNDAFGSCDSLTSVTIPGSITSFILTFSSCNNLTNVVILDGVPLISYGAFQNCSALSSITIPDSVTCIDDGAFTGCKNLTSIIIPDSVTSINRYAFYNCSALKDVYYAGSAEDWAKVSVNSTGNDAIKNATIHYNSTAE